MGEIVAAVGTCHTPYMFTRPPDEDPNQLEQAGAAMNELGKVLDETKPDAILFFGADHVETFSVSCVPSFAIVAGDRADREVRRARAQPADPPRAGRGHPQQARRRSQLRHGVLGGRRARSRVLDPVRVRDRQAQHPGRPVLHQRLRSAAADAAPLRGARQGDRRDHQGRKERVAIIASGGMSHFPGTTKYLTPEFDFDRWLVSQFEAGNTDALLNMTGTQLDEVGNTEMLSWAVMFGAIGAHRRRADRLHPDLAPRAVHDALPAAARAHERADEGRRADRRLQVRRTRASCSTSTRRQRRTG